MTIETKYNIGDEVWFIENNEVHKGEISQIKTLNTLGGYHNPFCVSDPEYRKKVQEIKYNILGWTRKYPEELLHPTKEELLKSL